MKKLNIRAGLRTRNFRVGGYSVFASLMVAALAVMVNVLVNALPASVTQLDTNANQLFSISDQTEQVVEGLETPVEIYWVVQSGAEDSTLSLLLDRYAAMSDQITITKKDPDTDPGFITQYVSDGIYNNSLIVVSRDEDGEEFRSTYVDYDSIYVYDYDDYYTTGSYGVSFDGEGALTSAISYVVSEDLPKLYTLTGHGESELSSTFTAAVEQENMEIESLSLINQEAVPEDADCVLIYGSQSDISEEELQMLLTYLQAGGRLLLITDPLQDGQTRPNLDTLMAEYGLSAAEGLVVEGDPYYYAYGTPYYLLPDYGSHEITSPLSQGGYYVLLATAQGLTVSDSLRDGLTVTELLPTSEDAFSKTAGYDLTTYEKEDGDIDGPFALAAAVTDAVSDTQEAKLVWVSSTSLLDDQMNLQVSGGNQDFFLNALGWMVEQESSISIHAKSLSTEYLTINSGTASLLSILLVGVLPLGYLCIGIYIWARRKRQ